jgi:Ras GTPase-activating-like protein IQGAP2/3
MTGVLLKIHQFSPRQYDKVQISISSNEVGIFSIEMTTPTLSTESIMGYEQIRMEDLLQAQFDNEQNLLLFEGMASFSINMLIHQINKSTSPFSIKWSMLILQNSTLR